MMLARVRSLRYRLARLPCAAGAAHRGTLGLHIARRPAGRRLGALRNPGAA